MIINNLQLSFASLAASKRKVNTRFFDQINLLIDWDVIDKEIKKHYQKGKSADGRPSYSGLVLFKMCLLQTWYGLSDYALEERVNDSISFGHFVGLTLDDNVPDHSIISKFRTALTKCNAFEKLMLLINEQLEAKQIILTKGAIIDASVIESPRKPRGKKEYEIVEDRAEEEDKAATSTAVEVPSQKPALQVKIASNVDTDAAWLIKAGRLRYGYKKHVLTDEEGMIRAVVTTAANESDTKHLKTAIEKTKLDKGSKILADKGYCSQGNSTYLKENNFEDGIMQKATKSKVLTEAQQQANKVISQTRYKVERTFGSVIRWFKTGTARYVGLQKMHTQNIMEAIAHNLKRSPGIVMSNALKVTN